MGGAACNQSTDCPSRVRAPQWGTSPGPVQDGPQQHQSCLWQDLLAWPGPGRTGPLRFLHQLLIYANTELNSSSIFSLLEMTSYCLIHRVNNGFLPPVLFTWEKAIPDTNPHLCDAQGTMPSFSPTSFELLLFHLALKMEKLTDSGIIVSLLLERRMWQPLERWQLQNAAHLLSSVSFRGTSLCQPVDIKDSSAQQKGTIKNSATILKLSTHLHYDTETSTKCLVLLVSHLSILQHSAHPYISAENHSEIKTRVKRSCKQE